MAQYLAKIRIKMCWQVFMDHCVHCIVTTYLRTTVAVLVKRHRRFLRCLSLDIPIFLSGAEFRVPVRCLHFAASCRPRRDEADCPTSVCPSRTCSTSRHARLLLLLLLTMMMSPLSPFSFLSPFPFPFNSLEVRSLKSS